MLGWLYLVSVLLAVAGIVYLDRGSVSRGRTDIGEPDGAQSDISGLAEDGSVPSGSEQPADTRTRVSASV